MVFPVVMYRCESWTRKKAVCWRTDAFELWCWRRLFRVPWTSKRSNQSILKEISPEYSLEWLMLKLILQHLAIWCEELTGKDPDAGKDWRQEEKEMTEDEMAGWHHWLDGRESEWTLGVGDGQGGLVCCESWGCKELDMTEWLNWADTMANIHSWLSLYCKTDVLPSFLTIVQHVIKKKIQILHCKFLLHKIKWITCRKPHLKLSQCTRSSGTLYIQES